MGKGTAPGLGLIIKKGTMDISSYRRLEKPVTYQGITYSLTFTCHYGELCNRAPTPAGSLKAGATCLALGSPHAGGAVTVPCSSSTQRHNFPKPRANFQSTASVESSGYAIHPHPKKQERGPTSAALDDVGESVPSSIFPGLFRTPQLSHRDALPQALNFGRQDVGLLVSARSPQARPRDPTCWRDPAHSTDAFRAQAQPQELPTREGLWEVGCRTQEVRGLTRTQGRVASPGPRTHPHPDPGAHGLTQTWIQLHPDPGACGLTQTQGRVASPRPRVAWPHPDPGPSLTRIQGHMASPGPWI
ncbi:hypothetical protein QTO34_000799 [Cnephaeus nilssonii]|uniref:Uncharacterized protein n=1 Tax=Cnephaeus nilssonii TaxID=3371016 RepID=A0AA40IC49_CNENI|nr:hypothetical protein QTO34_000799 [Eptesicus nilssonii]